MLAGLAAPKRSLALPGLAVVEKGDSTEVTAPNYVARLAGSRLGDLPNRMG